MRGGPSGVRIYSAHQYTFLYCVVSRRAMAYEGRGDEEVRVVPYQPRARQRIRIQAAAGSARQRQRDDAVNGCQVYDLGPAARSERDESPRRASIDVGPETSGKGVPSLPRVLQRRRHLRPSRLAPELGMYGRTRSITSGASRLA